LVECLENEVCVAIAAAQDHTLFLTETYVNFLFTALTLLCDRQAEHLTAPAISTQFFGRLCLTNNLIQTIY